MTSNHVSSSVLASSSRAESCARIAWNFQRGESGRGSLMCRWITRTSVASALPLFSRIVRYFELAELMAGMSPKCLAS